MGDETLAAEVTPRRVGPWRRELRAFVELLALAGIAVAQPALDVLGKNAGLFVTLRTSKIEAVAVALLVVLVPPVVLWLVEVAIGVVAPRARRYAHALIGAGLITVLAVEVLKHQTSLTALRLIVLAVPVGVIGGLMILRLSVMRMWLRYLAIAPLIFAVMFLFASPATAVIFENGTAPTANVHIKTPKRVVMVVLDEFPLESILDGSGHVDAALFPNFAALENDSTWFRNDTTVAPITDEAVPALDSGLYPKGAFKPPIASEYPDTIFSLLGGTYRMNVHEDVTQLCPKSTCPNAASSTSDGSTFETLVDTTVSLWREFASPKRTTTGVNAGEVFLDRDPLETGAAFVRSLRPGTDRQLDYLHVQLPHEPWHLRAPNQDDGWLHPPRGMYLDLYWNNAWSAQSAHQRHLLQVQAADHLVGDIIAKLKRIGAYDSSMIVVTADHGVAFTPGSNIRGGGNQTYPQILWTPLFVRTPGQKSSAVVDRAVRSIDVVPTIAEVIGAKLPWKADGQSLFSPSAPVGDPRLFEWELNEVKPPPGSQYVTFPGATGFAAVLAARASDSTADPDLRLYQVGQFGALVGRPISAFAPPATNGPTGTIKGRAQFDHVNPRAGSIPWAFVEGRLNVARTGVPLAIAVNGVIAGVSESQLPTQYATTADFWSTLAPQTFRPGHNTVEVYEISGTPTAPQLAKVRLQ